MPFSINFFSDLEIKIWTGFNQLYPPISEAKGFFVIMSRVI